MLQYAIWHTSRHLHTCGLFFRFFFLFKVTPVEHQGSVRVGWDILQRPWLSTHVNVLSRFFFFFLWPHADFPQSDVCQPTASDQCKKPIVCTESKPSNGDCMVFSRRQVTVFLSKEGYVKPVQEVNGTSRSSSGKTKTVSKAKWDHRKILLQRTIITRSRTEKNRPTHRRNNACFAFSFSHSDLASTVHWLLLYTACNPPLVQFVLLFSWSPTQRLLAHDMRICLKNARGFFFSPKCFSNLTT